MTLVEAIVIKETPEPGYFLIPVRDRRVANNLSIEALRLIQMMLVYSDYPKDYPLPGETEEGDKK